MKELYTKPLFAVENVSMFASSSRDCDQASIPASRLTLSDPANCVWDIGGGAYAFVMSGACGKIEGALDGEAMNFACYNNPAEGMYIFKS